MQQRFTFPAYRLPLTFGLMLLDPSSVESVESRSWTISPTSQTEWPSHSAGNMYASPLTYIVRMTPAYCLLGFDFDLDPRASARHVGDRNSWYLANVPVGTMTDEISCHTYRAVRAGLLPIDIAYLEHEVSVSSTTGLSSSLFILSRQRENGFVP